MWKSSCEWFKLIVCKMFMHKISMDYIMERKMFTFRAKSFLRSKIVATWRFILLHIFSNLWSIQSYHIIGILSIQKNWSYANAIFFQVQDYLKIYSCSSCDAIFLFDVRLTCCRPIASFGGGVLACRFLLKAKAMTFISLVITWTMPCKIWLIFILEFKYSNYFCKISSCVRAHLTSIWILTSWIWLIKSTSVALAFIIASMRLLWAILDFHLILVFPTL